MPAGLAWRVCLALAVALAADGVAESRDTFRGHARSDGGGLLVLGTQKVWCARVQGEGACSV